MLGYEKFGAYKKALEFYAFAIKIVDKLAPSKGGINDQFLRAALSIVLNIAEGSGKEPGKDRKRFYQTARASAMECGAALDVWQIIQLLSKADFDWGKRRLEEVIAILSTTCRKLE